MGDLRNERGFQLLLGSHASICRLSTYNAFYNYFELLLTMFDQHRPLRQTLLEWLCAGTSCRQSNYRFRSPLEFHNPRQLNSAWRHKNSEKGNKFLSLNSVHIIFLNVKKIHVHM